MRKTLEETPFIRARLEWDDRYANQSRATRNWQIATLLALLMATGFALGLLRLASQSRLVPYVVEVDRHGHAVAFGPAEQLARPDERVIRYFLAQYLENVRTVLTDSDGQRHFIDRAYTYSSGEAVSFLNAFYQRENPFEAALRSTRRVEVTSLLPIAEETWQAHWVERTASKLGRVAGETSWQAILLIDQSPPTTSDTLLTNPLGLYVTELTWQRTTNEGGNP